MVLSRIGHTLWFQLSRFRAIARGLQRAKIFDAADHQPSLFLFSFCGNHFELAESKATTMRTSLSTFLVAVCAFSPEAVAFAPPHSALTTRRLSSTKPALSALLPEHVDALSTAADSFLASTHLLADATEAVAEEATKSGGWWGAYLNIFENAIKLIHSTLTPPLNNMGVTETWGISIAVFTAGRILH